MTKLVKQLVEEISNIQRADEFDFTINNGHDNVFGESF